MGWLVKFKTIINMLTLLLGDKIITKPTVQLNIMLLHMVICLSEVNLTLVEIVIFFQIKKQKIS